MVRNADPTGIFQFRSALLDPPTPKGYVGFLRNSITCMHGIFQTLGFYRELGFRHLSHRLSKTIRSGGKDARCRKMTLEVDDEC